MSSQRVAALAAIGLALAANPAGAQAPSSLHVSGAWVRPNPPGAPTAAGYVTVSNTGRHADRLVGASSPAAHSVEIHQMSMAGGVMRMRPAPEGVAIPAGGTAKLAPDGYHLMLIAPKRAYRAGEHIPVTLTFARAGKVAVDFTVGEPPAPAMHMEPGQAMHMGRP